VTDIGEKLQKERKEKNLKLKCVNSNRTKISLTSRGKDSSTEETRKNFVRIKKVRLDKILAVVIAVKHPGEGESTLYTDGISFVFKRNPH
jgi:hypothetical protein